MNPVAGSSLAFLFPDKVGEPLCTFNPAALAPCGSGKLEVSGYDCTKAGGLGCILPRLPALCWSEPLQLLSLHDLDQPSRADPVVKLHVVEQGQFIHPFPGDTERGKGLPQGHRALDCFYLDPGRYHIDLRLV